MRKDMTLPGITKLFIFNKHQYVVHKTLNFFFWIGYSVPAILLPIIIWALWIEQDYYWHTLLALGVMLEIISMVPQFHFISESMHLHTYVILYIMAMAIYVCLYITYDLLNVNDSTHQFEYIVIVAKVAQLIVYLDFFLRILPWLMYRRDRNRLQSNVVVVPRDNRIPQPV